MPVELHGMDVTGYVLPSDGPLGREHFLNLLHAPGETWIADYGFTEEDLCKEIEAADASGVAVHLLLDRTQSAGTTERKALAELSLAMVHGDITISTAGPLSQKSSEIMHSKVMIVDDMSGGSEPWCWVGSVNFSESGWYQANVAFLFRSSAFAASFLEFFEKTKTWAREHIPQLAAKT